MTEGIGYAGTLLERNEKISVVVGGKVKSNLLNGLKLKALCHSHRLFHLNFF